MSAGRICTRVVATIVPEETVRTAARRMAEQKVGTLVVVQADGTTKPIGMVTDRDIAVRCVGAGLDPESTPVSKVMSSPVTSIGDYTPIDEAISRMASVATRRLVVTSAEGTLVGILSLDDVLGLITEEAKAVGRLLSKQEPQLTAPGPSRS
jgi:CBS domain-containing protein